MPKPPKTIDDINKNEDENIKRVFNVLRGGTNKLTREQVQGFIKEFTVVENKILLKMEIQAGHETKYIMELIFPNSNGTYRMQETQVPEAFGKMLIRELLFPSPKQEQPKQEEPPQPGFFK